MNATVEARTPVAAFRLSAEFRALGLLQKDFLKFM